MRVGIVGLDHWYAGRAAAQEVQRDERAELVVIAHRQRPYAEEAAKEFGAKEVATDYEAVVRRDDLDLVVTACRTRENPGLCRLALESGKAVVSVKPLAMTLAEADEVVQLARARGRLLFPLESQLRLSAAGQLLRRLLAEGRLGRPISALTVLRGTVPRQEWPGREVERTWWMDPAQVPGGGWIDHAIYHVDLLRWLLGSEVERVYAETANLKHPELAVEDFGTATLRFQNGVVATLEVTWAGTPGAWLNTLHLVGTEAQVILDDPFAGRPMVGGGAFGPGWKAWEEQVPGQGPIRHVLDVLEGRAQPIARAEDARANLAVCLAAYASARSQRAVPPDLGK